MMAGVLVDELRRRKVEGQEQVVRPGPCGFGCLAKHELRQRSDDAALLGYGDEDGWRDVPQIGVGPSGQRLEADDAPRRQVDYGLEVRLHLAGRDRAPQRLLDMG